MNGRQGGACSRWWAAAAAGAMLLLGAGSGVGQPAALQPLTVDDFLAEPAVSAPALSPSGRYVAFSQMVGEHRRLVVYDRATKDAKGLLSATEKQGITFNWIRWKDENRLLVNVTLYVEVRRGGETGKLKTYTYTNAIIAMDRDGGRQVFLLKDNKDFHSRQLERANVLDPLKDDPSHVLMVGYTKWPTLGIWKVNVETGAGELIERGARNTVDWATDRNGAVVARWDRIDKFGSAWLILMGRAPGAESYTELMRTRAKDLRQIADFSFLGPAGEPGQIYARVEPRVATDGDTASIRIFDFRTKSLGPVLWRHPRFDVEGVIVDPDSHAVLGGCYVAEVYQCDYADPALAARYKGLARFFDDSRNIRTVSRSDDDRNSILLVTGPDEPGTYYLYDREKRDVRPLGVMFPKLAPNRLGRMEKVTWKARDGLELSGYLTLPPTSGPAAPPLVVMPHGGPETRDRFDYDLWGQFLATRGFAVFQPNFRGSAGFGRRFAAAGYGQWGGTMQSDVEDGVDALIAAGRVDAKRMCVFGASYGGYVALQAAAASPDRYRCVASFAGVSDLAESVEWEGRMFGINSERFQYWAKSIGDPKRDRAALDRLSPALNADRFRIPVLLVHGEWDSNVPFDQSERMEAALKRAGKEVKLVKLIEEGHGDWREANHRLALAELEVFLARHLAVPSAAP